MARVLASCVCAFRTCAFVVAAALLVAHGARADSDADRWHDPPSTYQPEPRGIERTGPGAAAQPDHDRGADQSGAEPASPPEQDHGTAQDAAPLRAEFHETLSQFGQFVRNQKYGEVWIPTVTPQGWHPYPPCHWVNTGTRGWFFDDRTPWGAIVHHYGRWAHDEQSGWIWVPGNDFSPGWVVWRTGQDWIGWAPMLPDADIRTISADQFDTGGFWIFMETAKFSAGCAGDAVAPAEQTPNLVRQTRYVTQVSYVDGIAVFQLPPAIVGEVVDIDMTIDPWPAWFFTQVVANWNWVWANLTIVVVNPCPPRGPR